MKGYLWNMVYTDLSGNTYNSDVITTSVTPTNESRYGHVNGILNGVYQVQCGDFNNIICGLTIDEITEFSRVDYNHTSGNKIVMQFTTYDGETRILSVTDDFVPGSSGATYEFHYKNGKKDVFVVGEQVPDYDEEWIFNGSWLPGKDWPGENDDVIYIHKPGDSSCYVELVNGEYHVRCVWR